MRLKSVRQMIHKGDRICFIDLPIREDEIKGMTYLTYKNDKFSIYTINSDNVACKRTFDPRIKYPGDHVFVYDCSKKTLKLI